MSELESATFDPRRRRLCPDGACVGIVGDDGRCKVCGRQDDGSGAGWSGPHVGQAEDGLEDVLELEEDSGTMVARDNSVESFDPSRALCPDGACVGVIGNDRRCKVCGRNAEV